MHLTNRTQDLIAQMMETSSATRNLTKGSVLGDKLNERFDDAMQTWEQVLVENGIPDDAVTNAVAVVFSDLISEIASQAIDTGTDPATAVAGALLHITRAASEKYVSHKAFEDLADMLKDVNLDEEPPRRFVAGSDGVAEDLGPEQ